MHFVRSIVGRLLMVLFSLFPLQNKVVFSSFDGNGYNDNPKAIYLKLRELYPECRYIWFLYGDSIAVPGAEVVKAYSIKALYHQATAKLWVFSSRQREWMHKRNKQLYIQTWHGGIALKQIEKDIEDKLPNYYVREAIHDSEMADLFISASSWNTNNIRQAFWYDGEILESGLPRSDMFYEHYDKNAIRKYYGLPANSKILVYAPTFRDDGNLDYLIDDFYQLFNVTSDQLNCNSIIVKLHPNIQAKSSMLYSYSDKLIDGSKFDLSELLLVADCLITDYSSCMFDALELKLPTFLYTPDVESYLLSRELYFDFDNLPFSKSLSVDDLVNSMEAFDMEQYMILVEEFLKELCVFNDGTASETVVDWIEKHCELE